MGENSKNEKEKENSLQGNAGMGKSTLGKKIGLDWAKGWFKMFSIIFFVVLRIVNPSDSIEDVIIQQNSELLGLGLSRQKLSSILDKFGDRCLLILDGLDEHGLGQNEDVLNIIRDNKLLNVGVLITSRPHGIRVIETFFLTVVRVDGFTQEEAKKFVSNFFTDKYKIQKFYNLNLQIQERISLFTSVLFYSRFSASL